MLLFLNFVQVQIGYFFEILYLFCFLIELILELSDDCLV